MEDKWWDLSSYHYDYFGQNNSLTKKIILTILNLALFKKYSFLFPLVLSCMHDDEKLFDISFSIKIPTEVESSKPPILKCILGKNSSLLLQMIQSLTLKLVLKDIISFPIIPITHI